MAQRKRPTTQAAISLTHPNAAGIDIGSTAHFVAVPPDRDDEPVREFASFTADLHRLADWLDACGVDTVAMESTGVYWIPLYELLESRGFTVFLVNARHVKNVSGRKSDVLDCQWLQQLMSFGLLRGAFRPADQVCVLRLTSVAPNWLSATRRFRRSCRLCMCAKTNRPKARSAGALAMPRSSICAPSSFRCAAWTSPASTAST